MSTSSNHLEPAASSSRAEAAIELREFIDELNDGIVFLDREWRITYANECARRISRIEPHHINGPTHWELYPATIGTAQEQIYRTSMEQRVSLNHEFFYSPFAVWISLRTYPIASGIGVHYRDITRLRQAETQGDEMGRQLYQVFDTTSDAIVMFDRNDNFTFLNRRARELLAPRGDTLGKNLWECFPESVYEGSPWMEAHRRAMDERIPTSYEAYYPEPLHRWLAVEVHPAEDGVIVFFRDTTQRRVDTEKLQRKSEEAQRQAIEIETLYRTAPIGLALFDPVEFRYLRLNDRQAAFFGLKPEDVVGRTLTEMAPIPGLRELFGQVAAGRPVVNHELEGALVGNPGEHRYWTVNYSPVQGPDGSVQAISAASLEITQQKKAERALLQSEKLAAVGRLASSISHEINNPLESVTNLVYLISASTSLSPVVREYVDLAQTELARVSQIVTQTLRFHRQSVKPGLASAAMLVGPVLNLYRGRLQSSGIQMETRFSDKTQILCLESEIRQVLTNLIGNAIDAMRSGGRLLIRACDATDHSSGVRGMRILVADTGHGMSRSTRERIFEPFFSTKDIHGTGLGLWVSTEIVQRHKGKLTVRSREAVDRHGTIFSLFLPLG